MVREQQYEWDPAKAVANLRKHGISFEDAVSAFDDVNAIFATDYVDPARTLLIAFAVVGNRLLAIIFIEIALDVLRIISARPATKAERKRYEEEDYR
jgi:uncharacterized DUF497 family protein